MKSIKEMTRTVVAIAMIAIFIISCNNRNENKNDEKSKNIKIHSKESKKDFFNRKMKEKNFQFEINGPEDDALDDTIHEQSVVYIESKTLTDSNGIVEFMFIDACCQEFLGDYTIVNDTLTFSFEQVNDESCCSLCYYRFKLTINEPAQKYDAIEIRKN